MMVCLNFVWTFFLFSFFFSTAKLTGPPCTVFCPCPVAVIVGTIVPPLRQLFEKKKCLFFQHLPVRHICCTKSFRCFFFFFFFPPRFFVFSPIFFCSDRILIFRIRSIRSPAKLGLVVTELLITSPVVSWRGWETFPPPLPQHNGSTVVLCSTTVE